MVLTPASSHGEPALSSGSVAVVSRTRRRPRRRSSSNDPGMSVQMANADGPPSPGPSRSTGGPPWGPPDPSGPLVQIRRRTASPPPAAATARPASSSRPAGRGRSMAAAEAARRSRWARSRNGRPPETRRASNTASPRSRARSSGSSPGRDRPAPRPTAAPGPTTAGPRASTARTATLGLPGEALLQVAEEAVDPDPVLGHGVAVADGDRPVLEGVEVDGDAERRADLVLAAVAAADRAGVIVISGPSATKIGGQLPGHGVELLVARQGQHGHLDRGQAGVQAQHGALLGPARGGGRLPRAVGVDQEGQGRAVGPGRRLDHIGDVAAVGLLVVVGEVLAGELLVLGQVEVGPVGDPLQLRPAEGELVLDVDRPLGVVGQLLRAVLAQAHVLLAQPQVQVPVAAQVDPALVPVLVLARLDEELQLHLLELAGPEDEVPRGDLVAERLADLGDPERDLLAADLLDDGEVDEDPLGRLRPQPDDGRGVLDRPHEGLEHQVEVARVGEGPAAAVGALQLALGGGAAVLGLERLDQVVLAEALVAVGALDQRVGERLEVPGGLPDPRCHDDGRVLTGNVVSQLHDRAQPGLLDVVIQLDPERTVVVARADPAVDLARLEGEAAALGQVDDRVHRVARHCVSLPVCRRRWLRRRSVGCRYRAMLPEAMQTIAPIPHTPTGCQTVLVSRKAAIQ